MAPIGTDTSAPYSVDWDTWTTLTARTDHGEGDRQSGTTGASRTTSRSASESQGSWVGTYGVDGYALGGFNGPGTSDLAVLPNATLTMEQGLRYSWAPPTTDVRALQSPDGTERRATGWYHATPAPAAAQLHRRLHRHPPRLRLRLGERRPPDDVTVADGTTTKTVPVTTSFQPGVWIHFPVSVPAGGVVRVTATKTAANNAVIAGLFLGGAGAPPTPHPRRLRRRRQPPPNADPTPTRRHAAYESGVKGSWVGTYGADGYALGGLNGPGTSDLAVLPNATLTMEQGFRYSWASPTTDVRALQSPDATERRATGWYHATQLKLRLNFTAAYTGTLHVYGFDWENAGRRMNVTVDRRHDHPDGQQSRPASARRLDPLPGQRPGGRLRPDHRHQDRRQQRRHRRPVPGRRGARRPNADSDPHPDAHADAHSDPHSDPHADPDSDADSQPHADAAAIRARRQGQLGRHVRRRRLRPGRLDRPGYERPGRAAQRHADPRAGLPLQLGLADDGCPGAPEPRRVLAPGDRLVPRHPAQAAAQLHGRLHRHAPRLRLRLGERRAPDERDRHRRHDDPDRQHHDQLPRRRLDALPGQRPGGRRRPDHRQPDRRQQRRHRRPVPGRCRDAGWSCRRQDCSDRIEGRSSRLASRHGLRAVATNRHDPFATQQLPRLRRALIEEAEIDEVVASMRAAGSAPAPRSRGSRRRSPPTRASTMSRPSTPARPRCTSACSRRGSAPATRSSRPRSPSRRPST